MKSTAGKARNNMEYSLWYSMGRLYCIVRYSDLSCYS